MTTKKVAQLVGTTPGNIISAIRDGRLPAPGRDENGNYHWTETDIANMRTALATDRRKLRRGKNATTETNTQA